MWYLGQNTPKFGGAINVQSLTQQRRKSDSPWSKKRSIGKSTWKRILYKIQALEWNALSEILINILFFYFGTIHMSSNKHL